jgi:hypothetical protein
MNCDSNFINCDKEIPFLNNHNSQRPTNYNLWKLMSNNNSNINDKIYKINYNYYYEPYFIASRNIPRFSELFGIGNDKTSHTFEVLATGIEFWVVIFYFNY